MILINKRNCINQTPLHNACIAGNHKVIAILLLNGADINVQDDNGKTPLHLAMGRDHLETIQMLIHFKANPNILDNYGQKPQDYIKKTSITKIVKNMLEALKIPLNNHFIIQPKYQPEHFATINNAQFITHQKNKQFLKTVKQNQHEII